MFVLLRRALGAIIAKGRLAVTDAAGDRHEFGDGSGPLVHIRLTDAALERRLAFDPLLAFGEGYMEQRLLVEDGEIYDVIELLYVNADAFTAPYWMRVATALRSYFKRLFQLNFRGKARRNVTHHYDADLWLYQQLLDDSMTYSCAYFTSDDMDLASAQIAKMRHIAAKLAIAPGQRVLDIGSGFGGLSIYLAQRFDVEVLGVTLSEDQLAFSRRRAADLGLQDRVSFAMRDYRDVEGPFDRIVSVGMLEHVGANHFPAFFQKVDGLLSADGVALLHSIGRFGPPGPTNPFIAKHIFPGGYIPALSEIVAVVENRDLFVTDVEIWRRHYAKTLGYWRQAFAAQRAAVAARLGERFARMWEFYLASSEISFFYGRFMVFQLQLSKSLGALDLTRDYMAEAERRLGAQDADR